MLGIALVGRPGKFCAAPYLLICCWFAPSSETEQGLERSHGLPAPIVAKDEFIKINLKLIAAHVVIGSDQQFAGDSQWRGLLTAAPTLRLCVDRSPGARARHMLTSGFLQPRKALETAGVNSRPQRHIFFQEIQERRTFEIRDDGHSSAPGYAAAFLHRYQDQRGFPSLQLPASPQGFSSPLRSPPPQARRAILRGVLRAGSLAS